MSFETRLGAVMDKAIEDKRIVGSVLMVARNGELVFSRAAGMADREAGIAMTTDAIFRLASVTKPIMSTTALVMMDKGLFGLDDKVRDILPWFEPRLPNGEIGDIRIKHLMTHTSGIDYVCETPDGERINGGLQDTDRGFEENFVLMNKKPLVFAPGTGWTYSLGIDILTAVIEAVHGDSPQSAMRQYVADPLGMKDATFLLTSKERLAQPYGDAKPEPERMGDFYTVTHDGVPMMSFGTTRIFNPKAFNSGGGGMAASADDVLRLLNSLIAKDSILKPETAKAALLNQIGEVDARPGVKFGLVGSIIADQKAAKTNLPNGVVTWGGVYGHSWSLDPKTGTVAVSLTNTSIEGCDGAYPEQVWEAIYAE